MDGFATGQHVDKTGDLSGAGRRRLEVDDPEGQGEAVLRAQPAIDLAGCPIGLNGYEQVGRWRHRGRIGSVPAAILPGSFDMSEAMRRHPAISDQPGDMVA